ncbi:unnamed protein product [Schistocephalus solidus]|uniref:Down syndrome cell adhesion molecule-like protein Dscam2 n=1 Tax=Schistocephalus solidus TaxID=70667 RepID=A0A183T179_SCHSO|nr:unnamed protein product [Schistocephalus solidus]
MHEDSRSCGAIVGLDQGNDFGRHTIDFHYLSQGFTIDGIKRSGEVNKTDGRWLLVAVVELQNAPHWEYLVHAATPSSESGLVRSRPRVTYRLKPSEDSSEDLRSNVDEAYAAVVRTICLISLLEAMRNYFVSPHLLNHLMKPERQSVDTGHADFGGNTGSTVELPWAVEGAQDLPVHWSWRSKVRPEAPSVTLYEEPVAASPGSGVEKEGTNQLVTFKRPWGSRYEFVQGKVGNLRLINVSVEDSGEYICESLVGRVARVVYTLKVRAPISVRIHPRQRVCDFGARVELECRVSGYPHQVIYWLHDAKLTSPLRHQIVRKTTAPDAPASAEVRERLIINSFSLEDIGVYQCVAESSLMDTATSPTAGSRGRIGELRESASSSSPSSPSSASSSSSSSSALSSSSSLTMATVSVLQSSISASHSASDLVDNAQDSAHLIMGNSCRAVTPLNLFVEMKPLLIAQSPTVTEAHGTASQVLLSVSRAELKTTIECRFASNPLPSITWYRDDLKVPLDENNVITPQVQKDHSRPYSLITRLRLDLSKVPPWDELWRYGGEYRAVANNSHGFADCRTFVLLDTELRLRPVDSSKPAIAGRSHDLKCYFIGSGVPKLQWLRIKKDQRVERVPVDHRHQLLENNRVLRITEVNKEQDEADYRCIATLMDMTDNITISLKVSRKNLTPFLTAVAFSPQTRKYGRSP